MDLSERMDIHWGNETTHDHCVGPLAPLVEPSSSTPSSTLNALLSPVGENLTVAGDERMTSFNTWRTDFAAISSYRLARLGYNNRAKSHDKFTQLDRLTLELIEAQRKVILFLRCIDSHKPAISFIGNSQFVHMITSLTFVPLIIIGLRQSGEEKIGLSSYVYLCGSGIIAGMVFTALCARVNQRVSITCCAQMTPFPHGKPPHMPY